MATFYMEVQINLLSADVYSTMSVNENVQRAHDDLVANAPVGIVHESCHLCPSGSGELKTQRADKEVAKVSDKEALYTQEQHLDIVQSIVARETSALTVANEEFVTQVAELTSAKTTLETEKSDLQNKLDVAEAEKSAAIAATAEVQAAFDKFQNELAEQAEIATRKTDRVAAVKAANEGLGDDYFTEDRAQRWAEMSQEAFDTLVDGLTGVTSVKAADVTSQTRETSSFKGGTDVPAGTRTFSSLGNLFNATGFLPASN